MLGAVLLLLSFRSQPDGSSTVPRTLRQRLEPIGREAGRNKAGANSAFNRGRQARIDVIAGK
jgi:hypothetical protein